MPGRLVDSLFKRRVLWVTGKGGTGKSTMAAALALLAADTGLRTLLIDVEARGDAARFLEAGAPRYQAKEIRSNLFHLALHPEEVLDEYLRVALKMPRVRRIGPVRRVFDFVATAAPGIKEVLIAGKVGFEERARNGRPRWDLIVVDAAPAGQVLSHLRGPRTIQEIVQVGMIRNQTAWVRDIIEDPQRTGVVIVSLPEEMPVTETEQLLAHLPEAVGTPVLGIVVNRVVTPPSDAEAFAAVASGNGDGVLADAAKFWSGLVAAQAPDLQRLRSLGPPTVDVPLFGLEHHDLAATRLIAQAVGGAA
jgi:anion-transporting  ArsA/GET3 family ATPase